MSKDLIQASPPVGVVSLNVMGVHLNDIVLVLTAIYTVFLIVDKAYSRWEKYQEKKNGKGN